MLGSAASARVDAQGRIDDLHLAFTDGRRRIVDVLWELRQPGR